MINRSIVLFGEAEKGSFAKGFVCDKITELQDFFGNAPQGSCGLHLAIQALFYQYQLIFFRVREEGFSKNDYLDGIKVLSNSPLLYNVDAICAPGVGDRSIIEALLPIYAVHHPILIMSEIDFQDYCHSSF